MGQGTPGGKHEVGGGGPVGNGGNLGGGSNGNGGWPGRGLGFLVGDGGGGTESSPTSEGLSQGNWRALSTLRYDGYLTQDA